MQPMHPSSYAVLVDNLSPRGQALVEAWVARTGAHLTRHYYFQHCLQLLPDPWHRCTRNCVLAPPHGKLIRHEWWLGPAGSFVLTMHIVGATGWVQELANELGVTVEIDPTGSWTGQATLATLYGRPGPTRPQGAR